MQDQDPNINYSELISRYLSGNASDAEVQQLEAWVLESSENKEAFITFKKAWMLSGMRQTNEEIDVDKQWETTAAQLFEKTKVVKMKPQTNRRRWLGIAAAIALLVIASIWIFQDDKGATLMVEAKDEIRSVDLPDGSQVTLNQSSSLRYLADEKEAKRKVELKGDAFFEVERDETKPFVINTAGIEVEVLGTSFYVDARDNQAEIQVIVKSGSVAVRSGATETILTADEKAVFQKATGQLTKQQNKDPNYLSLTTNTLVFEQTRLEEVVFALNRQFQSNITIGNEGLKDCELDATYKDKSLEAILNILDGTFAGIEVKRNGEQIELVGTVCE